MSNNIIELKSVERLLGDNFFIPSYQRGYRWKEEQVRQLINDIRHFMPTDKQPFYFLQALALAKKAEKAEHNYDVVDGQQRLTTIFLIFNGQVLSDTNINCSLKITPERGTNSSIDKYYQTKALEIITEELGSIGTPSRTEFCNKVKKHCRFLVYEVPSDKELSTFNELNSGKIPTKDSELVKCILLSPGLDEPISVTNARAIEWDNIERMMSDDDFFAFMTPRNTWRDDDRMTVLLRYAGVKGDKESKEVYPFLDEVQKKISTTSRERLWKRICAVYYRLIEWYKEPSMYHAFGWYVHRRGNQLNKTLEEIMSDLPNAMSECGKYERSENDYRGGSNDRLYRYLLLSNVAYCWKRWPMRYDFKRHRGVASWSLEHIFARNQKNLTEDELRDWIPGCKDEDWKEYQDVCAKDRGNEWLEEKLGERYPSEVEDNSLSNMAMLPKDANSSLNNKLFDGKRSLVIQWAENAWIPYWAPPVTEAVFMKSLPDLSIGNLFWSEDDKKAYVKYMKSVTTEFIQLFSNNK